MATVFKPGGVRDVPHGEFIAAYAKHLKGNDRVRFPFFSRSPPPARDAWWGERGGGGRPGPARPSACRVATRSTPWAGVDARSAAAVEGGEGAPERGKAIAPHHPPGPAAHAPSLPSFPLPLTTQIQLPSWVDLVKTGPLRELAPYDADWYYVRAAAIARKVYMRQALGVGALRRQFGGRNERRGTVPEHFARASGGVIRHILLQLEAIGIVEKAPGVKGGRRITAQGQRDLDLIAGRCERSVEPLGGAPPAVAAAPDAAAEAEAE